MYTDEQIEQILCTREKDDLYELGFTKNGDPVDIRHFPYMRSHDRLLEETAIIVNSLARDKDSFSFADVGSGIGHCLTYLYKSLRDNKPELLIRAIGYECDEEVATISQVIHQENSDIKVINIDMFDVREEIGSFDFIYMYRPIANSKLYSGLVDHVWAHMRLGAYLYQSHMSVSPTDCVEPDLRLDIISDDEYLKHSSAMLLRKP